MLKKVIRYQINGMKEEKQIEIIFEDVVLKKGKNRKWLFRNTIATLEDGRKKVIVFLSESGFS